MQVKILLIGGVVESEGGGWRFSLLGSFSPSVCLWSSVVPPIFDPLSASAPSLPIATFHNERAGVAFFR